MEFILWHYTIGFSQYLRRWFYAIGWVVHYFSLFQLLPSLFSPWKRLIDNQDIVGINFSALFRQFTFNIISRVIGAIVRTTLFLSGLVLLVPVTLLGLVGAVIWVCIPLIGLPYYLLYDPGQKRYLSNLASAIKADPSKAINVILDSRPGRFLLTHINLVDSDLSKDFRTYGLSLEGFEPTSFQDFMSMFINSGVWDKQALRAKGVDFDDILLAAKWWDSKFHTAEAKDTKIHYARPGIGLELLFGYTPVLNQYSSDLSLPQAFSHHLIGRSDLVSRLERVLSSGNSVVLVGDPGVGKKTVVLEFARKAMAGELGPKMIYQRVMELDYNFLLSKSLDRNQKKIYLSNILSEASQAGNVILVIKDLHRLTNSEVEGLDFTDLFETHFEGRKLKLIAISSRVDYERFMSTNSRLRKFLEPIEALPATKEQATDILMEFASQWESAKHIIILASSIRAIITGSDKYISDTPFPEKALEILDNVISYVEKNDKSTITPDDVNQVISETTGISLARLSEKEKELLADLETYLHRRLVGQDAAITAISKSLRARSVGAKSESRPLGSFLLLGPTGVGKTETAKTLAEVYFGSQDLLLRFDMAEYTGPEGVSRLIGSVSRNLPGRLTSAIKNRPASLLLLDEIEKAPPEVYNLLLSLLDEGHITDAFGQCAVTKWTDVHR
jgi:ATP-dependent Clp protease ATP-binding subunit ClpA